MEYCKYCGKKSVYQLQNPEGEELELCDDCYTKRFKKLKAQRYKIYHSQLGI